MAILEFMITGLNHITLAVGDLNRSIAFYADFLEFSVLMRGESSAYLQAGKLWLGLVVDANVRRSPLPEYTHIAFTVSPGEFSYAVQKLIRAGVTSWQTTERANCFYFLDPDGHKLELHSGDLRSRLRESAISNG